MTYTEFRRRMMNFTCHNERFDRHFYIDLLGRAHCRKTCQICIQNDKLVQDKVTKDLESCIDLDSNSASSNDWDIESDTGLFMTNYNHKCSSLCCSRLRFGSNINKVNLRDFLVYAYYQNVASDQKIIFENCHRGHNDLYKQVLTILRIKLKGIYTLTVLLNNVLGSLSIRQLKMKIDNCFPVSLDLDIDYSAYPGRVDLIYFSQYQILPIVSDVVRHFLNNIEYFWHWNLHYCCLHFNEIDLYLFTPKLW